MSILQKNVEDVMNTVIDLLLSLFLLTSSPWLWALVAVAAVCVVGIGVSAKGLSNAKKGEQAQQARLLEQKEKAEAERKAAEEERAVQEANDSVEPVVEEAEETPEEEEQAEETAEEAVEQPEEVVEEAAEQPEEIEEEPVEEPAEEAVEETEPEEELVEETCEDVVCETPVEEAPEVAEEPEAEEVAEEPAVEEEEQVEEPSDEPEDKEDENVGLAAAAAVVAEEKNDELDISVDKEGGFVYYNGYRRSFESKLIQSLDLYKDFYSALKNKLLSYKKVHARMSWSCESFRLGRKLESKLAFRGRTLCLYLALNPDEYPENIYHQRNMGDKKKYAEVPMMVRVRSKLGLKRALTLIEILMEKEGVALDKKFVETDYSDIAYEPDAPLIERGLIKIVKNKRFVTQQEGESREDAIARVIKEIEESEKDDEDFPLSPEEQAEELEYTVDEEQHFIYYTVYRRSFESRLIQSKDVYKDYYSALKNELLSYKKIRSRISWACESFRQGRELKAKLAYRGKTLCLYLALNPDEYPENIYHQRNMGSKKKYAEVPMMVRVRSDLGLKRALQLIKILMEKDGVEPNAKYVAVDYSKVPYEPDAPLIERGLIKLGKGKRAIVLRDGETEEEAVKRTVEEIKQSEKEEDEAEEQAEKLQYTVNEEQKFIAYTTYRRSFESKLIQSKDVYKGYYSTLKNELTSYKKVHARKSWSCESFRLGRVLKAKLAYRGKTLCLYLALDPEEYPVNIYHQRNVGDKKKYAAVPLMVRVRSDLGLKRAVTLIKVMMTIDDVPTLRNFTPVDYSTIPYEEDAPLIERKLIKLASGKRFFDVKEGESQEEAIKRTVEEIKAQNAEENGESDAAEENGEDVAPTIVAAPENETPAFAETSDSLDEAPETAEAKEEVPEFSEEEKESEEIVPEELSSPEEEVPEFAETAQQEEKPVPDAFAAPENETPEFQGEQAEEETAPEEIVDDTDIPDFAETPESRDEAPETAEAKEEVPEFSEEEKESEEIVPEELSVPEEEVPEFAENAQQEEKPVPDAFAAPENETPDFQGEQAEQEFAPEEISDGLEAPEFAESESENGETAAPETVVAPAPASFDFAEEKAEETVPEAFTAPENEFVPSFDAPDKDLEDEKQEKLVSPEEAFLSFVTPDDSSEDAPARFDVVSESGPVIPKDIEEGQLAGVSDDFFTAAPTFLEGGEEAPQQAPVVPAQPTQDLFGRPLPAGLYDDVPMKPKKKEEVEPEVKREIPTGELSPEDAKKVAEEQAALDALIEEEGEVALDEEDESQYEIVGVAEDISAFTAFENKVLGASNKTKYFYSEIKNAIMSYKFVKCKTSNAGDSFRQGSNLIARITLNNNKLRLHLCLNPKAYSVKLYNHYSLKNVAQYQEVPFTLELNSRKDLLNATKLVQDAMASKYVIELDKKREYVDYAAMYTLKSE